MFLLGRGQMLKTLLYFSISRFGALRTKRPFLEIRKGGLVVFVGQGIGHTRRHLLIGSLQRRGEFIFKVLSQLNHQHIAQELCGRVEKQGHGYRGTQLGLSIFHSHPKLCP